MSASSCSRWRSTSSPRCKRDDAKATEAGLKYFVLGALSSGMLLYGASLVYGFTGHDAARPDRRSRSPSASRSIGLIFGMVFLLAGIAFKISAVPFHMWTPDVYEGAPTPVTAFFAAAPKVAAMALFIRVVIGQLRADHPATGSRSSSSSRSPRWCSPPSPPSARTTSSACSPIPRSAMSASRSSGLSPGTAVGRRGRRHLHGDLHRHDHRHLRLHPVAAHRRPASSRRIDELAGLAQTPAVRRRDHRDPDVLADRPAAARRVLRQVARVPRRDRGRTSSSSR